MDEKDRHPIADLPALNRALDEHRRRWQAAPGEGDTVAGKPATTYEPEEGGPAIAIVSVQAVLAGARCARCRRRHAKESRSRQELWNTTVKQGVIVGFLCPRCQTDAESAEATINEATIDYGRDQFGRLTGRPKVR